MATNRVDFVATRGDTMHFQGTLTVEGRPFSLPVSELKFSAKRKYQDATVIFEKTLGDGVSIAGQSTTQISYDVIVAPEDTATLDFKTGKLLYDLQLTEADGTVSTPVGGRIVLSPDVTPP